MGWTARTVLSALVGVGAIISPAAVAEEGADIRCREFYPRWQPHLPKGREFYLRWKPYSPKEEWKRWLDRFREHRGPRFDRLPQLAPPRPFQLLPPFTNSAPFHLLPPAPLDSYSYKSPRCLDSTSTLLLPHFPVAYSPHLTELTEGRRVTTAPAQITTQSSTGRSHSLPPLRHAQRPNHIRRSLQDLSRPIERLSRELSRHVERISRCTKQYQDDTPCQIQLIRRLSVSSKTPDNTSRIGTTNTSWGTINTGSRNSRNTLSPN